VPQKLHEKIRKFVSLKIFIRIIIRIYVETSFIHELIDTVDHFYDEILYLLEIWFSDKQ
jgi:hypothetical protein